MALSGQLLSQVPQRLGRPPQRGHRIPPLIRFHQPEQCSGQFRIVLVDASSSTARPSRSPDRQGILTGLQLGDAFAHRGSADATRFRDRAEPAVPQQSRLGRQRQSLLTLVQIRQQHLEAPSELATDLGVDTHTASSDSPCEKNKLFLYSSARSATCATACLASCAPWSPDGCGGPITPSPRWPPRRS